MRDREIDKLFRHGSDFEDIEFPVKIRDICKIEKKKKKKRILLTLVFLVMKAMKNIRSIYQKNVAKTKKFSYY